MARGKNESNKTYFKVDYDNGKPKTGNPYFAEQVKVNGSWVGQGEDTFLEGRLVGIKQSEYMYDNEVKKTFELTIDGGDEFYSIQFNFAYFTRGLLNSLASIKDFSSKSVKISVYRNKDGYTSFFTEFGGDKTDWLLENDKLPKHDDGKWNESFDYLIKTIKEAIEVNKNNKTNEPNSDASSMSIEQEAAVKASNEPSHIPDNEDSDLPF